MPEIAVVPIEPLAVEPARHAQITFSIAAPRRAELIVDHLNDGQLLARECRPLPVRSRSIAIKTHPEASQIACLLKGGGVPNHRARFRVECGRSIEPAGRHFIVIGAMKAGTTSLFRLLAQHPELCRTWVRIPEVSFPKEINYFRHLYREGDTPQHYDWRFPFDPARHAWTLEVSPNYAKWPGSGEVPARIASFGAETKLAYIMREPIDRIESQIAHTLHRDRHINLQHCIRTSCYAMQLDKFMEHFDREDVLLLDFAQLQEDPAAILTQICDFLSIDRIVAHATVHNQRILDYQLDPQQRAELLERVRPDIQRLIDVYGFTAAQAWLNGAAG